MYLFIYRFILQRWKTRGRKSFSNFPFLILCYNVLFCEPWIGRGLAEPPGRWERASSPSPSCAAAESRWSKSRGRQSNRVSYGNKWRVSELSASSPSVSPGFAHSGSEQHVQQPLLLLLLLGVWAPKFGYFLNMTKAR